jgi:valyl-tRNA synthetase
MNGKNVLYLPGVDHAGIATQVVVEKKLTKDDPNFSRHEIGREKFIEKVWEWKDQYGKRIVTQLRRAGASLDWTRERFTMDEQLSKAVNEAFVRLHENGVIYRDTKLVNWCCKLKTAISNIEVEHEEFDKPERLKVPGHDEKRKYDFGYIWSFAYKIEDSDREVVVATTRPETMLGDTAVAVHPDDDRYKDLHGKFAIHPFNGRRIPIITDSKLVDPKLGTGAVKITPAHDPNDYECGKRHKLEFINILTDDGKLNDNGAQFTGMMRYDARNAVVKALEEKGLFRDKQPHKLAIGKCSRSGDIIEPMLKPQWYVDCKEAAATAVQKVRSEELKIYPEREKDTWYRWLENIQDWCISRQLWWGHRIPAYFVTIKGREDQFEKSNTDHWVVARTREEATKIAAERFSADVNDVSLEQDEDVLDTWFSSGLFPFSTMGWPEDSQDMKAFYPNQMLETGVDILFFWVARMVMMGLSLTGKLPFDTVFLHAMVRDKTGKKMSKSLGNVIDPIDVMEGISLEDLHQQLYSGNLNKDAIDKAIKLQKEQFPKGIPECGTDALRFTLLNFSTPHGRDINLDVYRVFGYRTFCNKLWNATKFALMNLTGFEWTNDELPNINEVGFADKWILSRLNHALKECNDSIAAYDFQGYTAATYDFFLKELCDVYLEMIKPIMSLDNSTEENIRRKRASQLVLFTCLEQSFRLMHPAMPFITEELWQRLPGVQNLPKGRESIMVNSYPKPVDGWSDVQIEKDMQYVMEIINYIRSAKGAYQLTNKQRPEVFVKCGSEAHTKLILAQSTDIIALAFSGPITIAGENPIPEGCAVEIVNEFTELHVVLKGMIDFNVEIEKQKKNKAKLQQAYDNLVKKMALPSYKDKVPERVQIEDLAKLESYKLELEKFDLAIVALQKLL